MSLDSLRQMSACARLLCTVRLRDAEGVTQCREAGLQIELRRLRQIRFLTKVVQTEESGAALHLRLHQCGRSYLKQKSHKGSHKQTSASQSYDILVPKS